MIEAEKTFDSSQELTSICTDNVIADYLFTKTKEGDELIIINISEEKNMNLKVIAEKGLKLIKEIINTCGRLKYNNISLFYYTLVSNKYLFFL